MIRNGDSERLLLKAAIRVNTMLIAAAFGLTAGAMLCISTYILLLHGGTYIGSHLSLLSIFLPGYSVSTTGAWIGFFWGLVIGAISGAILYRTYARTLRDKLPQSIIDPGYDPESALIAPTAMISGHALGLGLGALAALQLFVTTNWLVFRGTAENSAHAALLENFVPGYSVTFGGSVIGAAALFLLAYVCCLLLGVIYNGVAKSRMRRASL